MHILVSAFEPYDCWEENASWLVLMELTKSLPAELEITTRRYPVDFRELRIRLAKDMSADFDYAIHLGQAPGTSCIQLEAIGVNVCGELDQKPEAFQPVVRDGPVAFRSDLPLAHWASQLRESGIPTQVSYHAGTYLCNATLYLSHYLSETQSLRTKSTFIHLPLESEQVIRAEKTAPSLPKELMTQAVRLILDDLATGRKESVEG